MSSELRKKLLKYGITALIGVLMVFVTISSHGFAETATTTEKFRIISDAFSIPGVVFVMCGFLVMVSNGGFFNGISYAMNYAVRMLIPGMSKDVGRYSDYVEQRKGKKLSARHLFIVGAAFLFVAIVFVILFYIV